MRAGKQFQSHICGFCAIRASGFIKLCGWEAVVGPTEIVVSVAYFYLFTRERWGVGGESVLLLIIQIAATAGAGPLQR